MTVETGRGGQMIEYIQGKSHHADISQNGMYVFRRGLKAYQQPQTAFIWAPMTRRQPQERLSLTRWMRRSPQAREQLGLSLLLPQASAVLPSTSLWTMFFSTTPSTLISVPFTSVTCTVSLCCFMRF